MVLLSLSYIQGLNSTGVSLPWIDDRVPTKCPVNGCPVTAVKLKRHWKEIHEELVAVYRCNVCGTTSKRRDKIVIHTIRCHSSVPGDSAVSDVEFIPNKSFVDPAPLTYAGVFSNQ